MILEKLPQDFSLESEKVHPNASAKRSDEKLPQDFSLESEKVHPNASSKRSDDHEQLTQDDNFFIARVRPSKSKIIHFSAPK